MFYDWLGQQADRHDAVGTFARLATRDKVCPRRNRLYLYLLRYAHLPEHRAGIKLAHREWRRVRDAA